jgi:hypothetical protein
MNRAKWSVLRVLIAFLVLAGLHVGTTFWFWSAAAFITPPEGCGGIYPCTFEDWALLPPAKYLAPTPYTEWMHVLGWPFLRGGKIPNDSDTQRDLLLSSLFWSACLILTWIILRDFLQRRFGNKEDRK